MESSPAENTHQMNSLCKALLHTRLCTVDRPDMQGSDCTRTFLAAADNIDTPLLLPAARGKW